MREIEPLRRIDLVSPAATFVNRLSDMTAFRERFFRSCRTRLFQMLRRTIHVSDERFEVVPHDEYLTGIHSGQCLYGITELAPVRGLSLVTVSRGLLSAVVDDMFGAGDIPGGTRNDPGEVSAMERRIGMKLIESFAHALRDAFAPQLDIAPRLIRAESHPTLASVADAEELLCTMVASLATPTGGGLLSVAIPYRGLEPYRVALSSPISGLNQTEPNTAWSSQLATVTDEVEIDVVIETGTVKIPVQTLQNLKVGDILPLRLFRYARVVSTDGIQLCVADVGARDGVVHFRLRQEGV
ncbi:MAG TPA: FliM/FliN family flagellar motor switch protein [Acetobacteraceae bacterium]|nr:FliM/FliN family flagellar motor switch protein [Acetobacteraceae bacterium]